MSEMNRISEQVNRDYSMDILRILASLAVVLLHVSAPYIYVDDINSCSWVVSNFLLCATRWCVPVFFMISGAFMLQKDIPIKILWGKYISRLIIILVVWNSIYHIPYYSSISFVVKDIVAVLFTCGSGYHLWFIYALIGIYLIIPLLKKIVDGNLSRYVLCLWFCTSVLFFWLKDAGVFDILFIYVLNFPFAIDYLGYFILGYFLYNEVNLLKKHRKIIYILGLFALILSINCNYIINYYTEDNVFYSFDYHNIMTVIMSIALFVYFKYNKSVFSCESLSIRSKNIISLLSNNTLGIYLIHVFVLKIFYIMVPDYLSLNIFFIIPITWLLTIVLSFTISFIMSKIPYVRILVK